MKQILKDLEESIYDCKLDAGDGGDNLDCIRDAIELLDKLKQAINYSRCCKSDSELLKAYFEWEQKQNMNIESYQKSYLIDEFLDSL